MIRVRLSGVTTIPLGKRDVVGDRRALPSGVINAM